MLGMEEIRKYLISRGISEEFLDEFKETPVVRDIGEGLALSLMNDDDIGQMFVLIMQMIDDMGSMIATQSERIDTLEQKVQTLEGGN